MPYINKAIRLELKPRTRAGAIHAGELNFQLTSLIIEYAMRNGLSYTTINDVRGALACCADEFNRRVAVPYEQRKITEHGDVYPKELLSL